jgi:hypothetical protein
MFMRNIYLDFTVMTNNIVTSKKFQNFEFISIFELLISIESLLNEIKVLKI